MVFMSTPKKLTFAQFNKLYPDSDACLATLALNRFGDGLPCPRCESQMYRIKGRKIYACRFGHQHSPLKGTIFERSSTDLKTWFFVMYLMTETRSGISARNVHRIIGGSYQRAWRMMKQIRSVMDDYTVLKGEVEADETYFVAKKMRDTRVRKPVKTAVVGIVERKSGRVVVQAVETAPNGKVINEIMNRRVEKGSTVFTDGSNIYTKSLGGYEHSPKTHWSIHPHGIPHMSYFMPSADSGTQSIENFWGVMKRGIKGVYIHVAPKYMQLYAQEYAWRYSNRKSDIPMFEVLLKRI